MSYDSLGGLRISNFRSPKESLHDAAKHEIFDFPTKKTRFSEHASEALAGPSQRNMVVVLLGCLGRASRQEISDFGVSTQASFYVIENWVFGAWLCSFRIIPNIVLWPQRHA